jgi:hypothetical protein
MHIALIGMSGVRAHDPELTELGTSLPGFADRARIIASLPSLSLLTIAALTPDRHEVTHYEIDDIGEPGELPGCVTSRPSRRSPPSRRTRTCLPSASAVPACPRSSAGST